MAMSKAVDAILSLTTFLNGSQNIRIAAQLNAAHSVIVVYWDYMGAIDIIILILTLVAIFVRVKILNPSR